MVSRSKESRGAATIESFLVSLCQADLIEALGVLEAAGEDFATSGTEGDSCGM